MKRLFIFAIFSLSINVFANDTCWDRWEKVLDSNEVSNSVSAFIGLCDSELREELYNYVENSHEPISYSKAKTLMYTKIDIDPIKGSACSVYSPKNCRGQSAINCEHTWPKSLGASQMPAIGDLHHLYPASMDINSKRSHHPFCDVDKVHWKRAESKLGMSSYEKFPLCFEPPMAHKGNVARSMFYFAVRYKKKISNFEEETFRRWNILDPVDAREIERNDMIMQSQNNRNPFVDAPFLFDLISDL